MANSERLDRALAAIDAANAEDPNRIRIRGEERPKELAHAELVSEWLERLCPDASEALRLAGRAHHVRRWDMPRDDYAEGRSGYLRWRKAQQQKHARIAGEILARVGYDEATIARVSEILQKKNLGRDPDVQVFEDALCLVFLETQFRDLASRFDEDKLRDVTRKTLQRMSPEAIEHAVELPLAPQDLAVIQSAAGD